jgi:hypothetical protein
VVGDPRSFLPQMLSDSGITQPAWMRYLDEIRDYRDKFIAHLDDIPVMNVPRMNIAVAATFYLYDALRAEQSPRVFQRLPANLRTYAQRCGAEVRGLYASVT